MFHTISLFLEVSNDYALYKRIDESLPRFSTPYDIIEIPDDVHIRENKYRSIKFKDFDGLRGVRMLLTRRVKFLDGNIRFRKSYFHITINPKAVTDTDYINAANEADGIFALHEVDKLLNRMGLPLRCFDFKTSRIDVCYNHRFLDEHGNPSERLASEYLALVKRGKCPARFELGMTYSESQKRWVPYDNALVLRNCHPRPHRPPRRYIIINIYDKFGQLKRKAQDNPDFEDKYFYMDRLSEFLPDDKEEIDLGLVDSIYTDAENENRMPIDAAIGIIRFEIQLYNDFLQTSVRDGRQGFESRNIYNLISDDFTESMLIYYLKQISFPGDYYTFGEAKCKVMNSGVPAQPKTRERLLALLAKVRKHKAWDAAERALLECPVIEWNGIPYDVSENILRYLINKLRLMGVNLVTIPQDWTSRFFRNPVRVYPIIGGMTGASYFFASARQNSAACLVTGKGF